MLGQSIARLAAFLLSACLAQASVAGTPPVSSGLSVDPRTDAQIYSVDGGRLRGPLTSKGAGAREAMLQPGPHVLAGHVVTGSGRSPYRLRVNLEPGKRYVLHAAVRGYSVRVRVVERDAPRPNFGPTQAEATCPSDLPECHREAAAAATGSPTDAQERQGAVLALLADASLVVTTIDDKSARKGGWWKVENPRVFELPPGKHRVEMEFTDHNQVPAMIGFPHLWFVAAPGGRYFVKMFSEGGYFSVWIEDEAGRKVGGIAGSEDEPPA